MLKVDLPVFDELAAEIKDLDISNREDMQLRFTGTICLALTLTAETIITLIRY